MNHTSTTQEVINLGIFIGVSHYDSTAYDSLPSCDKDVEMMHAVASEVKKFHKTLILKNEKSSVVKDQIINLIEEYRGKKLNEIVFYFSGHGERVDDQYYYVLNDFQEQKRNSTGLSEDYLDGLIREAKPRVFTKIIDACFSGTKYIKDSFENKRSIIQKQANKLELDNIYYFFSSRDNQASYADKKGMSYFTDQLISCILDQERDVRYIDLSKELADAFSNDADSQQPIFVMQGSYLDGFGKITESQISELMQKFGVKPEPVSGNESIDKSEVNTLIDKLKTISMHSEKVCFDEKTIEDLLGGLKNNFDKNIPKYIKEAFSLEISNRSEKSIPNKEQIGDWLSKKKNLFATQSYSSRTVLKSEYVRPEKIIVKKQNRSFDDIINFTATTRIKSYFSPRFEEEELVLKEVKSTEKYISGFQYNIHNENNIFNIDLTPKHQLLPKISIWIVFIYSDKEFYAHVANNVLQKISWNSYQSPECKKWSVFSIPNIKKTNSDSLSKILTNEINEVVEKVTQQINVP